MKALALYTRKETGCWIAATLTSGIDMKTVQVAIQDIEYAQTLRSSLLRDGTHRVFLVDRPDLRLDGVVVIDGNMIEEFGKDQPERFVVIARKGSESLSRLWNAGIRHVVFEGDSPNTAQLAIIAAELRLPNPGPKTSRAGVSHSEKHHAHSRPGLPVLDSPPRCGRCSCSSSYRFSFKGF